MIDVIKLRKSYDKYLSRLELFKKIDKYYYGNTDSLKDFMPMEGRSNLKLNTNFMQKLVDEEAEYSFSNDVTYTSYRCENELVNDINYNMRCLKADNDINLGTELVKYCLAFEISYIDRFNRLNTRTVTPLNGYMEFNSLDEPIYFMHIIKEENEVKIDIYDSNYIYHCNDKFEQISKPTQHFFEIIPVGYGFVGDMKGSKTIYKMIKSLQDAYETNFSDCVCEISDFRNAILKVFNMQLEGADENGNEAAPITRNNAILDFNRPKSEADAEWLIKNVNDTFIKNTRDDLKDLIYSLTSHIDNNEKLVSNLSGIALRSRLNSLESKCSKNEKAMINIIKTRLYCLFRHLYLTQSKNYDVNTVKIQFTPKVPVDITAIADVISKLSQDVVSSETKRSLLPFVENPVAEGEKIKKEKENDLKLMPDLGSGLIE